MERNISFPIQELSDISTRLAWAQLEIYADEIEQIQVIASGDAHTLSELRIAVHDRTLEVEQPQYGISLDITHGHWLQLCVRVPKVWDGEIHASTISGLIGARGLGGAAIELETITGDLKASRMTAGQISLRTTAGTVRADQLISQRLTCRSVTGDLTLDDISAQTYKMTSVSGNINLKLKSSFEQLEMRSVSGDCAILTELTALKLSMRTVSGSKFVDGVHLTEDNTAPSVRVTGVSGDLKIIGLRKAQEEQHG